MKLSIALSPTRAVFAPLLFAGNLAQGIRRAAALGYDGIELNIRDTATESLDEISAAGEESGLEIVALGTGQSYLVDGLSILSPDSAIRDKLVERLKGHIAFASHVGAKVVLGGVFGKLDGDAAQRKAEYSGAIDVVRRLADHAAPVGVEIVIEPINRYETNFLNTIDQALAFITDADRTGLRVLPDTFHMNIEEINISAALERAGKMIGHFHLADSNRMSPGSGHIDFRAVLDTLFSLQYTGYVSGEFLPLPDDEKAAANNIRYIRKILEERARTE